MTIKKLISELEELVEEFEKAKTVCTRCNGSGWVTNPEWEEYWRKKKEDPNAILEEPSDFEEEICPECEGDGYVLTDDAMLLLKLLRKIIYW